MMIGDPSGFDVRAVEKVTQPLSAFADNSARRRFLQLVLRRIHDAAAGYKRAVHFTPSSTMISDGCDFDHR
jgi:hypothetical protein